MTDLNEQAEVSYTRFKTQVDACTSAKMIYLLGFMQGFNSGKTEGMKPLTPQEAIKVETETIGESIRYEHLGDVVRAQRQTS